MSNQHTERTISYGSHPWKVTQGQFDVSRCKLDETIFSLGNGNLGTRGTFEEGIDTQGSMGLEGTYLNGFYERVPIHYDETAYGYAAQTETMLNLPDGKSIQVFLNDEQMILTSGLVEDFHRELDFREGILRRNMHWVSPRGHRVEVEAERLISLVDDGLVLIRYSITPLNFTGHISLNSRLNGHVHNQQAENDPRFGTSLTGQTLKLENIATDGDVTKLLQNTTCSHLSLLSAMGHAFEGQQPRSRENHISGQLSEHTYLYEAAPGKKITLIKALLYQRSEEGQAAVLWEKANEELENILGNGWHHYASLQRSQLSEFWRYSDVEIQGDDLVQQGIRFSLFHLLQSAGKDGKRNIAAKGLTGEGYQGHYFWDSEIYVLPFFLFSQPAVARKMLEYRYHTLNAARKRAWELFRKPGALYPWRTISGVECSSYFPAGTAQYHINADIVYAIRQYVEATEDVTFLMEGGAEMVYETARVWMHIGAYSPLRNHPFCIHTVTGPDEYTALVNNNYYTNAMARMHLAYAVDINQMLNREHPLAHQFILDKINLKKEEVSEWGKAAKAMWLPKDEEKGIHPQDDSFLDKPLWPFQETPEQHYPLLLHYHPLDIYRHQVCKQADVVLAMYLLHDQFTTDEKKANLAYYAPITTHDSSLSKCIFSILYAESGAMEEAVDYFREIARLDLDNLQGNTHHGIHSACMAGAWLGIVAGFGGMRMNSDVVSLNPKLPQEWTGYSFCLRYRNSCVQVTIDRTSVELMLLEGNDMILRLYEKEIRLCSGEKKIIPRQFSADEL